MNVISMKWKNVLLDRSVVISIVLALIVFSIPLAAILLGSEETDEDFYGPAPIFSGVDYLGRNFSLEDTIGNVTVMLFIQIENPLCIECEEYMREEIIAMDALSDSSLPNISLITINIRKNSYSEDGWSIASQYYGVEITWNWVEEFEPFPIATKYMKYWDLGAGFANPTILLLDESNHIVAIYNIYCIGRGPIEGIKDSDSLKSDIEKILSGEWEIPVGPSSGFISGGTMAGMFLLGMATAFSPCSITLLMAVISFVAIRDNRNIDNGKTNSLLGNGIRIGIFFTIGTALVFMFFGLFLSYLGGIIEISSIFYFIAGILLIFFGINAIFPLTQYMKLGLIEAYKKFIRIKSDSGREEKKSLNFFGKLRGKSAELSGFSLGVLFSVGWAPCALTLVFPVLLLMITQGLSAAEGILLMFLFGFGHGIVIIPFCATTGAVRGTVGNRYVSIAKWIQPSFALILIALGVIFMIRLIGFNLW